MRQKITKNERKFILNAPRNQKAFNGTK